MLPAHEFDDLCSQFERSWLAGQRESIEACLQKCDPADRRRVARELLLVELELRRKSGEPMPYSSYRRRLPEYVDVIDEIVAHSNTVDAQNQERTPRDAFDVRCPLCHAAFRHVADGDLADVHCPECGSNFSLIRTASTTPGVLIAHFRLVEKLGEGAFGTVWKAEDTKLDRTVAVKLPRYGQLNDADEVLFAREARSAAQLSHPGIVQVYEVGRDGDRLYIVSEFISGTTLDDWLATHRPSHLEATRWCAELADALEHAHRSGVVHRDLKPSNIMLDDAGQLKLMDFGLARRDVGEITMTLDGQLLGTPAYMSPEQARGQAHLADPRSDIYSLGVVLYQMLTGELPFRGQVRMLIHQLLHDDPPPPRRLNATIPPDLETICLKCLQKEPAERYPTAGEVRDELLRFLGGEAIQARPPGAIERGLKWCKRKPLAAALVATLCGSALLSTAAFFVTNRARINESIARQEAETLAFSNAQLADRNQQIVDVFVSAFRSADPTQAAATHDMTAREVLEQARVSLSDQGVAEDPLATAALLEAIGCSFMGLGDFDTAIATLEASLPTRKKMLGTEHATTLKHMSNVARAYHNAGRFEEAIALLETTIRGMEKCLGPKAAETIENQSILGASYKQSGRHQESLALYEELLPFAETHLGSDHPITLDIMCRLGEMYGTTAQLDKALALTEAAYEKLKQSFGVDHARTLQAALALTEYYQITGRAEESLQLALETFDQLSAKLGPASRTTLNCMSNLATAYQRLGQLDQAIPLLEEAVRLYRSEHGPDCQDTAYAMQLLAYAYQEAERLDDALPLFDETLQLARQSWGPDHLFTQICLAHLVQAYDEAGKRDEEIPVSKEELERARSYGSFGHSQGQ